MRLLPWDRPTTCLYRTATERRDESPEQSRGVALQPCRRNTVATCGRNVAVPSQSVNAARTRARWKPVHKALALFRASVPVATGPEAGGRFWLLQIRATELK
jgi:hypothetical protein